MIESATKVPAAARAWLKPVLRAFPADRRAAPKPRAGAQPVRGLHLNESPYPPSPKAIEAVRAAAPNLNRYADANAGALASALSRRTGIDPERIVVACGSEELIQVLCALTAGPGDEVVVPAPSFPSFALSVALQGAAPVRAKLDRGGANDAAAILRALSERTRLVFCCTPNPPSGGMMSKSALEQVVAGVPDRVLLAVDEAYYEFGRHAGAPDALAILAGRRGPWAALRTFSKAYGLAGARIGYALCSDLDVADALRRLKLYYGASALAQAAALASLEDEAHLAGTLDAIARERTRLARGLSALGLEPLPSAANFVSVKAPMAAAEAMALLQERGILVRDWRDPEHPNELRITVGRADDTDAVLAAMRDIIATAPR
ncbi:MAG: aminotransferase class I/II-fold pyridoxal phosphate-dependent enzyme [Candidatus Odyssella sp.]|nr:aminotransferase class I/II-fold pyridoxal phosphate-dependent enzyme [Candidatus Odyssella sp.]